MGKNRNSQKPKLKKEKLEILPKPDLPPITEIAEPILPEKLSEPEEGLQKETLWRKFQHFRREQITPQRKRWSGLGVLGVGAVAMIQINEFALAGVLLFFSLILFLIQIYEWKGITGQSVLTKSFKGFLYLSSLVVAAYFGGVIYNSKGEKAWSTWLYKQPQPIPIQTTTEQQKPDLTKQSSEEQLARIEFRTESAKALNEVSVVVKFNRDYSPQELGHFRTLFAVSTYDFEDVPNRPALLLANRDFYQFVPNDPTKQLRFGMSHIYYSVNPSRKTGIGRSIESNKVNGFSFGLDLLETKIQPFKVLDDLNGKFFFVYVSESLVGKISEISLVANNYILISGKSDQLVVSDEKPKTNYLLPISSTEKIIQWRKVSLKLTGIIAREAEKLNIPNVVAPWQLDFTLFTPIKFLDKSVLD